MTSNKKIHAVVTEYLSELEKEFKGSQITQDATEEMSFRPSVHNFFSKLFPLIQPDVGLRFEPSKQQDAGRPDWKIDNQKNLSLYAYIDSKGISPENYIDDSVHKEQLERYISIGAPVVLTDGIEFIFYSDSFENSEKVSLITKGRNDKWNVDVYAVDKFVEKIRTILNTENKNEVSIDELISQMAIRARIMSDEIQRVVDLPVDSGFSNSENKIILTLNSLKDKLSEHHDPLLKSGELFSEFVAEVIVFGLFYGFVDDYKKDADNQTVYENLSRYWQEDVNRLALVPFEGIFTMLHKQISDSNLEVWYEDVLATLSSTSLKLINETEDHFHTLFEKFLTAFNPKVRYDFGVFYTPQPLVSYSVNLTELVALKYMNTSLYAEGNTLIDPCCGTGTYIEYIKERADASDSNPTIVGLEILPGPYVLAHYRLLAQGFEINNNLKIILTNTLSNEIVGGLVVKTSKEDNVFEAEQNIARAYTHKPITAVIGNPPSSDSAGHSTGNQFTIIDDLLNDFRPPANERKGRSNLQKQTSNEFMKFLRWSTNKIQKSENGIISLVLPSAFLEDVSYFWARKWIVEHFNEITILEIDEDLRRGSNHQNLFKTQQGRVLLVAVHTKNDSLNEHFKFMSIAGNSSSEKRQYLEEHSLDKKMLDDFKTHKIPADRSYLLKPLRILDDRSVNKYADFIDVYSDGAEDSDAIFKQHCSGVKFAPTSVIVNTSRPHLIRRSQEISDSSNTYTQIVESWFKGQAKPPREDKFANSLRATLGDTIKKTENIRAYSLRPFVITNAIVSDELNLALTNLPGHGTRYRPELQVIFKDKEAKAIAITPSPKDVAEGKHRFASFAWFLPDNDLTRRGNARVLSPKYVNIDSQHSDNLVSNINRTYLDEYQCTPDDMLYYVYAIISSNTYIENYTDIIKTQGYQTPKVPLPDEKDLFASISRAGKELAETEDLTKLNVPTSFMTKFARSMPDDFKLKKGVVDADACTITLIGLKNEAIKIENVSAVALSTIINGYSPVTEWLKWNSFNYTRSNFNDDHYVELIRLLYGLGLQETQISKIDDLAASLL